MNGTKTIRLVVQLGETLGGGKPGAALMCVGLMIAAFGCGSEDTMKDPVLVTGTVIKADGTPLRHGDVTFTSTDSGPGAYGEVDRSGRYKLTTYESGDGCVPGTYNVSINLWGMYLPDASSPPGGYEIPPRYVSPSTSRLEVEVSAGQQPQEINLQLDAE